MKTRKRTKWLGAIVILMLMLVLTGCGKVDLTKSITGLTFTGMEAGYDTDIQLNNQSKKAVLLEIAKVKNQKIGLSEKQVEALVDGDTSSFKKADLKKLTKLADALENTKIDFKFIHKDEEHNGDPVKVKVTTNGDADADKFDTTTTKTFHFHGLE